MPASAELERRLKSGELAAAVEVPQNFGEDLESDKHPEVSVWLDGAMPFRAETANGYVQGLEQTYLTDQAARGHIEGLQPLPINEEGGVIDEVQAWFLAHPPAKENPNVPAREVPR